MYLRQNLGNTTMGFDFREANLPPYPDMNEFHPMCDSTHQDRQQEDHDLSDVVLRYINQILMEEDYQDTDCMPEESLELQAAEKSFYEAIGKSYPPSPNHNFDCSSGCSSESYGLSALGNTNLVHNLSEFSNTSREQMARSRSSSSSSIVSAKDGLLESSTGSQSVSMFIKGVEEASKLIPNTDMFILSSQKSELLKKSNEQCSERTEKVEMRNKSFKELGGEAEGRSRKQAAVNNLDPDEHSDMYDEILLNHARDGNKALVNLRERLKNEAIKKMQQQNGQSKGPGSRSKQNRKKVVDLRTLLIECAEAVTTDDHRRANDLLKLIRQNSSPYGDGNQRLAHVLANGLEARLSGTGSHIYRALVSNRTSSIAILKATLMYLAACPFKKVSNLFSNRTTMILARGAAKVHIIDFGIFYGFQWPTFIQLQSERSGGPAKIRITGIDIPQPGFRPAQRVEETGRMLSHYANQFGVPFEFNPIAKRWETIQLEDLKLEEDEVVIVNCLFKMKNLPDETMVADRSRHAILNMIRKINPAVFIQGVVNGAYNAPFFPTRFREALFHFSAFFDMLENVMPRESEERMLLERDILGREALNVVACEGRERVERPETYKQWQAQTCRAGFMQLPLDPKIKDRARLRANDYHKEFVIDQDGQWLLLGWKGRIVYALSTWKPA